MVYTYQVWAFGKLAVGWSTRWIVNSLGPAAPVEPERGNITLTFYVHVVAS